MHVLKSGANHLRRLNSGARGVCANIEPVAVGTIDHNHSANIEPEGIGTIDHNHSANIEPEGIGTIDHNHTANIEPVAIGKNEFEPIGSRGGGLGFLCLFWRMRQVDGL